MKYLKRSDGRGVETTTGSLVPVIFSQSLFLRKMRFIMQERLLALLALLSILTYASGSEHSASTPFKVATTCVHAGETSTITSINGI
jgi:hypothetical protein